MRIVPFVTGVQFLPYFKSHPKFMCRMNQIYIYPNIIYQHFHNINAISDTFYSQNGHNKTDGLTVETICFTVLIVITAGKREDIL